LVGPEISCIESVPSVSEVTRVEIAFQAFIAGAKYFSSGSTPWRMPLSQAYATSAVPENSA
jgi:hypothetical protein